MVRGERPRVAPRVDHVAGYRSARLARDHAIGSYVGIPLTGPDGDLFGTLCGIGPHPSTDALLAAQPLLELQGRLLSSLLAVELRAVREARAAELARHGGAGRLLDLGSWQTLLESEQRLSAPHATPTSVIVLELDDAPEPAAPTARSGRSGCCWTGGGPQTLSAALVRPRTFCCARRRSRRWRRRWPRTSCCGCRT